MVSAFQDNWKQTQLLHTLKLGNWLFGEWLCPKCLCVSICLGWAIWAAGHILCKGLALCFFEKSTWEIAGEQRSSQYESIWTSLVYGTAVKCVVFSQACVVKIQKFPEVWFTLISSFHIELQQLTDSSLRFSLQLSEFNWSVPVWEEMLKIYQYAKFAAQGKLHSDHFGD